MRHLCPSELGEEKGNTFCMCCSFKGRSGVRELRSFLHHCNEVDTGRVCGRIAESMPAGNANPRYSDSETAAPDREHLQKN